MENSRNFFEDVYEVTKLIPKGRVTTYGAIANYLGSKISARMVGWAMNSCIKDLLIPAHRVVNRNGMLTGKIHFPDDQMKELLELEGIKIEKDCIIDFSNVFWDPTKEL